MLALYNRSVRGINGVVILHHVPIRIVPSNYGLHELHELQRWNLRERHRQQRLHELRCGEKRRIVGEVICSSASWRRKGLLLLVLSLTFVSCFLPSGSGRMHQLRCRVLQRRFRQFCLHGVWSRVLPELDWLDGLRRVLRGVQDFVCGHLLRPDGLLTLPCGPVPGRDGGRILPCLPTWLRVPKHGDARS